MTTYVTERGKVVYVGASFASGGEATIHEVQWGSSPHVAKVYRPSVISRAEELARAERVRLLQSLVHDEKLYLDMQISPAATRLAAPKALLFEPGSDLTKLSSLRGFVTEKAEGRALAEVIADDGRPLQASVSWARMIAQAVAYLHSIDCVIGDLKPENILLSTSGEHVTLLDVDSFVRACGLQLSGLPVLTPSWADPTLLTPLPGGDIALRGGAAPDRASDEFSLAKLIFSVLTAGADPFSVVPADARYPTLTELEAAEKGLFLWPTERDGYRRPPAYRDVPWNAFPHEIREGFRRTFQGPRHQRTTAAQWFELLSGRPISVPPPPPSPRPPPPPRSAWREVAVISAILGLGAIWWTLILPGSKPNTGDDAATDPSAANKDAGRGLVEKQAVDAAGGLPVEVCSTDYFRMWRQALAPRLASCANDCSDSGLECDDFDRAQKELYRSQRDPTNKSFPPTMPHVPGSARPFTAAYMMYELGILAVRCGSKLPDGKTEAKASFDAAERFWQTCFDLEHDEEEAAHRRINRCVSRSLEQIEQEGVVARAIACEKAFTTGAPISAIHTVSSIAECPPARDGEPTIGIFQCAVDAKHVPLPAAVRCENGEYSVYVCNSPCKPGEDGGNDSCDIDDEP